jgi:hypothetical protein
LAKWSPAMAPLPFKVNELQIGAISEIGPIFMQGASYE